MAGWARAVEWRGVLGRHELVVLVDDSDGPGGGAGALAAVDGWVFSAVAGGRSGGAVMNETEKRTGLVDSGVMQRLELARELSTCPISKAELDTKVGSDEGDSGN